MYTSLLINLTQFSLNPLNTLESTTWLKIGSFIAALGTSFFIYQNSDFLSKFFIDNFLSYDIPKIKLPETSQSLHGIDAYGNKITIVVKNSIANIEIQRFNEVFSKELDSNFILTFKDIPMENLLVQAGHQFNAIHSLESMLMTFLENSVTTLLNINMILSQVSL